MLRGVLLSVDSKPWPSMGMDAGWKEMEERFMTNACCAATFLCQEYLVLQIGGVKFYGECVAQIAVTSFRVGWVQGENKKGRQAHPRLPPSFDFHHQTLLNPTHYCHHSSLSVQLPSFLFLLLYYSHPVQLHHTHNCIHIFQHNSAQLDTSHTSIFETTSWQLNCQPWTHCALRSCPRQELKNVWKVCTSQLSIHDVIYSHTHKLTLDLCVFVIVNQRHLIDKILAR
jgi:hypothetical protein